MEFELEANKRTAKDVLEYLFSYYGESVKTDIYFKNVSKYLWNILNIEKSSSENHIIPSQENTETCKRVFNTVLLMMCLPLSLEYLSKIKSYKINKEIDYDDSNPKSVLYTTIHNVQDFVERIPEEYFTGIYKTSWRILWRINVSFFGSS